MPSGFEILLVAALIAAGVIVWRLLSHRTDSTISDHRPVCAACSYPLGGWSSPRCPECGADAREIGVRVGPRVWRQVLMIAMVALSLFVIGPFVFGMFAWVFQENHVNWHARWTHQGRPIYFVSLAVKSHWRRFPPKADFDQRVVLVRLAPGQTGSWVNEEWKGTAPLAKVEFKFDHIQGPPQRSQMIEAVAKMAPEIPASAQANQALDLMRELDGLLNDVESGQLERRGFNPSRTSLFSGGSGGRGSGGSAHWLSAVCSLLFLVGWIFLLVRVVKRHRPGWRPARTDEWEIARTD
jgi:hypothetical protein